MSAIEKTMGVAERLLPDLRESIAALFAPAAELERLRRLESLSEDEVEKLYGIKAKTLANWRSLKKGPPYFKDGGVIRYRQKDLQRYQESRLVKTGS